LLRAFLGVFENAFGDTISELHKLNPGVIKLGDNEHLSVLVREISLDYLKRFSDRIETVGNLVTKMNSPWLLFQYDEMFRSKYYTLSGHYLGHIKAVNDETNGQRVTQLQEQHFQARFYTQFDTHLSSLILSDKVMDIHLDAVLDRGLEILPEEHLHIQLVEQADDLEVLALQKSGHKWECFSHSIGVKPALRHVKEIKAYLASSDTSSESAEEFTEACIELGKLILEPVLAWAKFSSDVADSCPTLSICESDSINSVPWHALPLNTGMAIEKFNISVYPSFRYMVHCNFEPPEVSGDLEFIHIHGGDYSGLSSVEDESKTLSGIHSRYLHVSKGLLLDEDGSASPRGAINGENILHFSCHGIFNGEDPFQSYFDLGNGENIFAHELQQDSLAETSLVFLNCCDSGYVEFKPGKDPVGLSRPFLSNGVQNVVSTLWPVRDSFSADFAGRFYRNLETEKTVSALRKTQLEFLAEDRNPELMRNWACYSICGVY
jgi:CHAT domain-containing protein